jgi:protein SFI1
MEQQALDFQQETYLSILAGALRRVQWATFTATRKVESADALWARNRDQHIKQMLRHWAAQTAVRRSAALRDREAPARDDEEPDSPSLRPASRAASRSRARDYLLPSSPPTHDLLQSTPGYMRTPSRPRRAGRFRPLPTPAAFTPMAFESSYLVTTPAPIPPGDTSVFGDPPNRDDTEGLTPQITPFSRKLRAGGVGAGVSRPPTSALRGGDFRRSTQGGTNKSVRFAGSSRFRGADELHVKNS